MYKALAEPGLKDETQSGLWSENKTNKQTHGHVELKQYNVSSENDRHFSIHVRRGIFNVLYVINEV